MAGRYMITTKVISGFPAIGKSFLASKFRTMVRDLESSDYHWMKNSNDEFILNDAGQKIPNPDWPKNYIEAIKALAI